jgi:hypothetical protein
MSYGKSLAVSVIASCLSLSGGALLVSALVLPAEGQNQTTAAKDDKKPKVPAEEAKAANKVAETKDLTAKVAAAGDFVKKYPKSSVRGQIAEHVAAQIREEKDPAVRMALAELYLGHFKEPGEAEHINDSLINDYITAKRLDEAFQLGGAWLEKHPDDVVIRTRLAVAGMNSARGGEPKHLPQSKQYAVLALEQLEGDKKPANADDAKWAEFKKAWIPQLYAALGFNAYAEQNFPEARTRLEKVVALGIAEPSTLAVLGDMEEKEYSQLARKWQGTPAGPEKDALMKQAVTKLDRVIELFAQAVGKADGRPEFKALTDQLMQPLTEYYKYRHNGSTNGLQQLIDKYKKPAAQ